MRSYKNSVQLQKRVETGTTTLLIKVKTHRGDPLNEETDIRAELGLKKYKVSQHDFQRNPPEIEILSNLSFGSLEIRDTSVTRVTNKNDME